ncbi:ATP-dependent RNA helicase DbpA [Poseidonibacter lekithochrous]|uniref:ATP-dependent RNA helicase DbpA n=1 Tax=Poseidonibacter lekithochrous TaxID=1904463 RepID=UPI0008FCAFE4|nr:ATP-dependent RNA helicase DbpA [Poseidonibacter lekithochrous]QKJ22536.1 DEAD-box ATP-dependent RNA helicase [Poseidonibacter lekithochrous]
MNFTKLNLNKSFLSNLESLGFKSMTQIQELSLPLLLENKDVIAQAKTGSGKTVSFGIPLVNKLDVKNFRIQSLVLAPTRELANQIAVEIRRLSRHIHNVKVLTLTGGVPYNPQVSSLFHGAHIIVGTPGRVLKHIKEENINFENLNTLVLDEADKMLDMGFFEDISTIIESLPQNRQSMLFSATYEEGIEKLSKGVLNNPTMVEAVVTEKVSIEQRFYEVQESTKVSLISPLISSNKAKSILIFCNTKIKCDEVADELDALGLDVLTLHSDLDQRDRDEIITLFSHKSYPILIATDVASRGLHIDDIDLVINYDLARDEKVHTHRIGRTARAGKGGLAVSLYTEYEDDKVDEIKDFFDDIKFDNITNIEDDLTFKIDSDYRTLFINGGKKQKLRAGDILGALTAGCGLPKDSIGKINSMDFCSYVAVKKEYIKKAFDGLSNNKIKGKYFRIFEK